MSGETVDLLRARLIEVFAPQNIALRDDSALHAGHAGAREGGHYHLDMVSERFAGQSTVARHRLIYQALGDLMRGRVHALSINARAPGEV